jgi:hypothetical protein
MRVERKIVHEGRVWYSVPAAARLLHTRTAKVREIMGKGEVDWTQLKTDGKLLVAVDSILSYEQRIRASKSPK